MGGQLLGEEQGWVAARLDRVGESIEIRNPQNRRWAQDAPKHLENNVFLECTIPLMCSFSPKIPLYIWIKAQFSKSSKRKKLDN